jgi:hypothetical protein
MTEIIVAIVGVIGLVAVALIEKDRRSSKTMWEENKADHNYVVEKIETLGKDLGRSIDKTNKSIDRVESKLDGHIRDHAIGDL